MMCWGNSLVVAPLPHVSTYDGTRLMLQWGFLLAPELLLAAAANVLSRGKWARISAPRPRARLSSAGGALWTSCGGGHAQSIVRGPDDSRHRASRSTCARACANTCARRTAPPPPARAPTPVDLRQWDRISVHACTVRVGSEHACTVVALQMVPVVKCALCYETLVKTICNDGTGFIWYRIFS